MSDDLAVVVGETRKISTRKGEVVVRELQLEDVAKIFSSFAVLIKSKDFDPEKIKKATNAEAIAFALQSEKFLGCLKTVLCQVTDKESGFFDKMPLIDLVRVIKAFIEVNDIGGIKNLFFEIKLSLNLPKKE